MILAGLTETWMKIRGCFHSQVLSIFRRCLMHIRHFDLLRIVFSERQLIALHHDLHGIAQRRKAHQCHLFSGDEAHIQKMLPQRALSADGRERGRLADL